MGLYTPTPFTEYAATKKTNFLCKPSRTNMSWNHIHSNMSITGLQHCQLHEIPDEIWSAETGTSKKAETKDLICLTASWLLEKYKSCV